MSGRVTRRPDPADLPSMKDRNPTAWWVAVVLVAAMVLSAGAGLLAAVFG